MYSTLLKIIRIHIMGGPLYEIQVFKVTYIAS